MEFCTEFLKQVRRLFTKPKGLHDGMPQSVDSGQASQLTDTVRPAEWYLDLATKCMGQAQQMISGNVSPTGKSNNTQLGHSPDELKLAGNISTTVRVYHNQCKYLVEKLERAVDISRDTCFKASSPEHKSGYCKILKLVYRLATEVQGFLHDCCKDEGMQVPLTAASVPARVCSLGYDLELCTHILRNSKNLRAASPTETELESLRKAEELEVKERGSLDEATLLDSLKSLILSGKSSNTDEFQLATILQKRLEASQGLSQFTTVISSQLSEMGAWKLESKKLLRLKELGTGSSATVYKAKWFGDVEVADKVFAVPSDAIFENEVSVLAQLSHPNIVSFLGYSTDEHSCSVATELMDGDLYMLMETLMEKKNCKAPFSNSVACDTMLQVAEAVEYMHEKGIVHRDLKSQNVLVRRSNYDDMEYVCVKVADFGLSTTKERSFACTYQTSNTGSSRSMAPELIELPGRRKWAQGSRHPRKSDVYSFGMLCFEILTGEVPFLASKEREVKEKVLNGIRPELPQQCPQELRKLIELCWNSDSNKRPYFPEICEKLRRLKYSLLIECSNLPEQKLQAVNSRETPHATSSAWSPQLYLDQARQCMENVQTMTANQDIRSTKVKLYHNQCQYLADTLEMAVEESCRLSGSLYTQTQPELLAQLFHRSSFTEHKAEVVHQVSILRLLWRLAADIEGFIQECCGDEWVTTALISTSDAPLESVSSLGYYLKLYVELLSTINNSGAALLTETVLESWWEAEKFAVHERAALDGTSLFNTLKHPILSDRSSSAHEIAILLEERLRASRANSTGSSLQSNFEISSSAFKQMELLGTGSYTTVYRATWLGAEVALKTYNTFPNSGIGSEVSYLQGLCHPNIVRILGHSQNDRMSTIVMELMDEDLFSTMQRRLEESTGDESPFNIDEAVDLILQIAEGVNYLHQHKVLHRYLRSNNILLRRVKATKTKKNIPELLYAKVADFGLSKLKETIQIYAQVTRNVGTSRWMAPELIKQASSTSESIETMRTPFESDIHSFGMLCYEILTGKVPFPTISSQREVRKMILEGNRPKLPQQCPGALKALIEACWLPDPRSRPTSTEICQKLRYLRYTSLLPERSGESPAQRWYQQAQATPQTQPITTALYLSRLPLTKIECSRLHRGIQLGKGGPETTVYETIYHRSDVAKDCVAHKRFVTAYNDDFKREVTALADLKHSNIVSLVGYAVDSRSCSLVMEMMDGDLHDLMWRRMCKRTAARPGPFFMNEALHVMLQIAQGMDCVHHKYVVHRDLKSKNILVRRASGGQLDVKVTDFGLSEKIKPGSNLRFNIGTPAWMAPEVMRLKSADEDAHVGMSTRRTPVSSRFLYFSNATGRLPLISEEKMRNYIDPFKSDIYSFGIVCFEILTGHAPSFHSQNRSGDVFKKDRLKAAVFLLFLLLEGLIKLKEDPQKVAAVVLLLLEGLSFKKDFQKAIVVLLLLRLQFKKEKNKSDVLKEKVLAGHRPVLPDYCPPQLKSLIESCWDQDASARPTFAQIIRDLRVISCS